MKTFLLIIIGLLLVDIVNLHYKMKDLQEKSNLCDDLRSACVGVSRSLTECMQVVQERGLL